MRSSLAAISRAVQSVMGKGWRERRRKHKHACRARWLAWHAARQRGYSFPEIGRHFGYDHTSVLSGTRKMTALLAAGEMVEELARVEGILALPVDIKRHRLEDLEAQVKAVMAEIAAMKGAA